MWGASMPMYAAIPTDAKLRSSSSHTTAASHQFRTRSTGTSLYSPRRAAALGQLGVERSRTTSRSSADGAAVSRAGRASPLRNGTMWGEPPTRASLPSPLLALHSPLLTARKAAATGVVLPLRLWSPQLLLPAVLLRSCAPLQSCRQAAWGWPLPRLLLAAWLAARPGRTGRAWVACMAAAVLLVL